MRGAEGRNCFAVDCRWDIPFVPLFPLSSRVSKPSLNDYSRALDSHDDAKEQSQKVFDRSFPYFLLACQVYGRHLVGNHL